MCDIVVKIEYPCGCVQTYKCNKPKSAGQESVQVPPTQYAVEPDMQKYENAVGQISPTTTFN
jgi:hypothetical protein